jgi:pheromone shutdown protein TraB
MPARLSPANVRMAAAKLMLPLASAAIAAAAAYVAGGTWTAIFTAFCAAYIFAHNFWGAVVDTAGGAEISQETDRKGDS